MGLAADYGNAPAPPSDHFHTTMSIQRITIRPDGSIAGLEHKNGLPLRQFGKADIKRITLIEWDEEHQGWFIRWFEREGGRPWKLGLFSRCSIFLIPTYQARLCKTTRGTLPLFDHYEEAVAAEVAVIQALQALGTVPAWGQGEETIPA